MARHTTYPKKEWRCPNHQPVGRPFGRYDLEYSKENGNLKRGFARQKCTCGSTHRVEYTPHWVDEDCSAKKKEIEIFNVF